MFFSQEFEFLPFMASNHTAISVQVHKNIFFLFLKTIQTPPAVSEGGLSSWKVKKGIDNFEKPAYINAVTQLYRGTKSTIKVG